MHSKNNGESYELITEYHLAFNDWTQALEPLIEFHKNLMDQSEYKIKGSKFKNYS